MELRFLGAESLGVRSLATKVRIGERSYLLDPGVSIAPRRHAHPPHPLELAALEATRAAIQDAARTADAIAISHYHHDHFTAFAVRPLDGATPERARELYAAKPIFAKHPRLDLNGSQRNRAREFWAESGLELHPAEGSHWHALECGKAAPHGPRGSKQGFVAMIALRAGDELFVHASDIQLLDPATVDRLIAMRPTTVLVSGPPLYHPLVREEERRVGLRQLERLARAVPRVIVDHHLVRDAAYRVRAAAAFRAAEREGHLLQTAAEAGGRPPLPLEDLRPRLWEWRRYAYEFVDAWTAGEENARREVDLLREAWVRGAHDAALAEMHAERERRA